MSYILDALKRAEVERERERATAPGLLTHQRLPMDAPSAAGRSLVRVLGAALLGAALVSGLWFWRATVPTIPSTVMNLPTTARPSAPPPPAAVVSAEPAPAGTIELATSPASATAKPPHNKPEKTPLAKSDKRPEAIKIEVKNSASEAPLLTELPAALRNAIPKISITGSVYSDTASHRLLLVNNQVLTQGQQLAPDLTLQQIQVRSSVFDYKGTQFRVMH